MEKIKILKGLALIALFLSMSCTKYDYDDTGLSKGNHNCSMWEYMCGDSLNWYHTVAMIRHAGMEKIFQGGSEYGQITFLGITNIPILSYLKANKLNRVEELDVAFCRTLLERLIVPNRKVMRDEVARGNYYTKTVDNSDQIITVEEGGEMVNCISGKVWMYSYREMYNNVPAAGEVALYMMSKNVPSKEPTRVVSTNIQTLTGVVQALSNKFKLTQI
ncbi:MAG: fasciclin [Odoribacter sp.]